MLARANIRSKLSLAVFILIVGFAYFYLQIYDTFALPDSDDTVWVSIEEISVTIVTYLLTGAALCSLVNIFRPLKPTLGDLGAVLGIGILQFLGFLFVLILWALSEDNSAQNDDLGLFFFYFVMSLVLFLCVWTMGIAAFWGTGIAAAIIVNIGVFMPDDFGLFLSGMILKLGLWGSLGYALYSPENPLGRSLLDEISPPHKRGGD